MRWCCSFPRALLLVLLLGWWGRSSGFKICSFKLQSLNSTKAANKRVMYTLKRVGHAHTQTRIHIHMFGLFVELSSCLSLSVYLSVYLPVFLSNFISLYLSMSQPAYFSTYLSLPVCVSLSVCLSFCLSLPVCLQLVSRCDTCLSLPLSVCRWCLIVIPVCLSTCLSAGGVSL